VTFRVSTRGPAFQSTEARVVFFDPFVEELSAMRGLSAVGAANALPTFPQFGQRAAYPADLPAPVGREPRVSVFTISEAFLEAIGVPVLSGRAITRDDRQGLHPLPCSAPRQRDPCSARRLIRSAAGSCLWTAAPSIGWLGAIAFGQVIAKAVRHTGIQRHAFCRSPRPPRAARRARQPDASPARRPGGSHDRVAHGYLRRTNAG